ncbi:MAG: TRIC cation channel family protein, partial [Sulfurimonas sp.]|nr:TRIC cation channel family protein [Sulfurimonas sp.]
MPEYFIFADIIGIIAFGISGFLIAIKNDLDILGILIASALTALGGGIIRDAILSSAPFAFTSLYPAVTLISTIFLAFMFKLYNKASIEKKWIFVVSDTIGLVAFSITGALLAINAQYNFFGIVILSF